MKHLCVLLSICGLLEAQQPSDLFNRASPDVEAGLRAKVNGFYDLQKTGKYRAAEKLVCEDSRDEYYEAAKPSVKSYEVLKIAYEDDFKKAQVTLRFEGELKTPHGAMPTVYALTSQWRVEGGSWCLHVPPKPKEIETPWGISKVGEKGPGGAPLPPTPVLSPSGELNAEALGKQIVNQVKFSRTEMKLQGADLSFDEIEIQNGTSGPIRITPQAALRPGLRISIEPKEIAAGQVGKLRLDYQPPDRFPKPHYDFQVMVEPYQKLVKIHTVFDLPESIKRQLPPDAVKK